jgi:hypothetical protein
MIIPFDEALKKSEDSKEPRAILLGNGFSISCNPKFDYRNLYEKSEHLLSDQLKNLFITFDTYDFESIIEKIENAEKLISVWNPQEIEIINKLNADAKHLRQIFAKTIIDHHATYNEATSSKRFTLCGYRSCVNFLANFSQIFTTNYDLLIYWMITHEKNKQRLFPKCDGFGRQNIQRKLIWKESSISDSKDYIQNVYYLHGALFFVSEKHLIKLDGADKNILKIVQDRILNSGEMPFVVFEGSTTDKLRKIENNHYLDYAYKKLKKIEGDLFIYGHALCDNDDHILQAIKQSKVKKIFIGIFNQAEEGNIKNKARILEEKNRTIEYYDAKSIDIWQDYSYFQKNQPKAA